MRRVAAPAATYCRPSRAIAPLAALFQVTCAVEKPTASGSTPPSKEWSPWRAKPSPSKVTVSSPTVPSPCRWSVSIADSDATGLPSWCVRPKRP